MKLIEHISPKTSSGTVATIGFFDGVHKGHQFLINQIKNLTQDNNLDSLVVTFDQHPRVVLSQSFQPKLLNSLDEKITQIDKTGVDYCCVLPFTKELSQLSSYQFLKDILRDKLQVKKLVIGHDHRFGHKRTDNFEQYQAYGKELGIDIIQAIPFVENGITISSSGIRHLLEKGEVEQVKQYLNYDFNLTGTVVHGKKIGRTIHFPTANIAVNDPYKLIPSFGIYAVKIEVDGFIHKGMLSIGTRPTVNTDETVVTIEVNIFDFNQDLYNKTVKIIFVKRVRDELKFDNLSQLELQIQKDEKLIRQILLD